MVHVAMLCTSLYYPPMAYTDAVEFIETSVLTKALNALLTDNEYRLLQNTLWRDPLVGDVVRGGGGIRKMRFAVEGRGKSGGV